MEITNSDLQKYISANDKLQIIEIESLEGALFNREIFNERKKIKREIVNFKEIENYIFGEEGLTDSRLETYSVEYTEIPTGNWKTLSQREFNLRFEKSYDLIMVI